MSLSQVFLSPAKDMSRASLKESLHYTVCIGQKVYHRRKSIQAARRMAQRLFDKVKGKTGGTLCIVEVDPAKDSRRIVRYSPLDYYVLNPQQRTPLESIMS